MLFELLLVIWGTLALIDLMKRLNEWRADKTRKLRDLLDEIGEDLKFQRREMLFKLETAQGKQRAELQNKLEKVDRALAILKKLPAEKLDKLPMDRLDKLFAEVLARLQAEVDKRRNTRAEVPYDIASHFIIPVNQNDDARN